MAMINPYLNFPGNTEDAFNFYKSVFGGEFATVMRFGDAPEKDTIPAEIQNKIMHIALPIGHSILMATDAIDGMGPKLEIGNNMSISISAASLEEAHTFYDGLSQGGQATMPLSQQSWGDTFGMLIDPFGIQWMISFNEKYNP